MSLSKPQWMMIALVGVIILIFVNKGARSFVKGNGKVLFALFLGIAILFTLIKLGKSVLPSIPVVGPIAAKVFGFADQLVTP